MTVTEFLVSIALRLEAGEKLQGAALARQCRDYAMIAQNDDDDAPR